MATKKITIYKLEWYIEQLSEVKSVLITNEKIALERYNELNNIIKKSATYDSAWLSLHKLEEDNNFELKDIEVLHHNEY